MVSFAHVALPVAWLQVSMTSPVITESSSGTGKYKVSFTMPSKYALDTLPIPDNANVQLKEVSTKQIAPQVILQVILQDVLLVCMCPRKHSGESACMHCNLSLATIPCRLKSTWLPQLSLVAMDIVLSPDRSTSLKR